MRAEGGGHSDAGKRRRDERGFVIVSLWRGSGRGEIEKGPEVPRRVDQVPPARWYHEPGEEKSHDRI